MDAIVTEHLRKTYGKKTAVCGLDLTVGQGELFALLGVNGAGKTTTIKMLTGLIRPSEGEARLMGHSIRGELDEVKKITNVSPQETAVAYNLTVRENLELIAGIYGKSARESREAADGVIRDLELASVEKERARTLSGGWQRRLSIAMALITHPQILFLDEPTLGLDVLARRELWHVIGRLKGATTVILTTHYLEEAEALADRIGVMAAGELKAAGTAAELKALAGKESFEDAFIVIAAGEEAV